MTWCSRWWTRCATPLKRMRFMPGWMKSSTLAKTSARAAKGATRRRFSPTKQHFQGVVQTIWSGSGGFLDQYYGRKPANDQKNPGHTESKCFVRMFEEIANLK